MVRRKLSFIKLVRGRRTRICFARGVIKLRLNSRTPSKDNSDPNTIDLYPNYQIQQGEIDISTRLPAKFSVEIGKSTLKSEKKKKDSVKVVFRSSNALLHSDQTLKPILENLSWHIIQVHFKYTNNRPGDESRSVSYINSGTGVLIEHNGNRFVLTCLHNIFPRRIPVVDREIFLTYDDYDYSSDFTAKLKKYTSSKRKIQNQSFVDYLQSDCSGINIWKSSLNKDFVNFRKDWLANIQKNQQYVHIIDPISQLKPSPAFDIAILDLENATINALEQKGAKFARIDDLALTVKPKDDVYLFGYHDTDGFVNFLDEEYKKTVILDEKIEGETQKEKVKLTVELSNFINPNKSISTGKCKKIENGFLAFKASTSEGSSGGPVFDSNGQLIGISFGNVLDVDEGEDDEDDQLMGSRMAEYFDIKYPDEQFIEESRNYNLAVSIDHPGLVSFLKTSAQLLGSEIDDEGPQKKMKIESTGYPSIADLLGRNHQLSNLERNVEDPLEKIKVEPIKPTLEDMIVKIEKQKSTAK